MSVPQPTAVAGPCARLVRQLFEAAELLQARRLDLAEACRESGCGLLDVSAFVRWPAGPRAEA